MEMNINNLSKRLIIVMETTITTGVLIFVFWLALVMPIKAETKQEQRIRSTIVPTITQLRKQVRKETKEKNQGILDKAMKQIKEIKYGAKVNGTLNTISNNSLTITNDDNETFTVYVSGQTKLRRKFWGDANVSEFSVGNAVNVIGKWKDSDKTQIDAIMIRNTSIQKVNGVFIGTVKSKTSTGFVLETLKRETQTVTVDSGTKIVNRSEGSISLADIQVGHRVRVKGMWDRTLGTVTEVTHVKDFSLPPLPTKGAESSSAIR